MPEIQLLAQTYDSITFQYREDADETELLQRVLKLIEVELIAPNGRKYVVPGECKVGWNWGAMHDPSKPIGPGNKLNPEGLIKWKSGMKDSRTRGTGLKRVMV